jgi:hypothetical protein
MFYFIPFSFNVNHFIFRMVLSSSYNIASYIEGYIIPIVSILSFSGNLVTIWILQSLSLDMKTSFRHILVMLSAFDTTFSFLAAIIFSLPILSPAWNIWVHPLLLPWLLPGLQIALSGSIWSTVMVAVERYVSIVHPSQR